jgi:hypothetical protein
LSGYFSRSGDAGNNRFTPLRVIAWHSESQASPHLRMPRKNRFNGFREDFPPRHIDLVAGTTPQIDQAIFNQAQVAGSKHAMLQTRAGMRPVTFPHSLARHLDTPVIGQ